MLRCLRRMFLTVGLSVLASRNLIAQGMTGAAVQGTVVSADSVPIEVALVELTNASTGEAWRTTTRSKARDTAGLP